MNNRGRRSKHVSSAEKQANLILADIAELHFSHGGSVEPELEQLPTSIIGRINKMLNDFSWSVVKRLFPFLFKVSLKDFEQVAIEHNQRRNAMSVGGDVLKALDWLLGYETTRFKQFLKAHGEEPITSIQISRVPISKTIGYLFNIISLGYFEKARKKLGYDSFYHLSLVINGTYRVEKNETVNQKPFSKDPKEELVDVPLDKEITIDELIKNGAKSDPKKFWSEYDALGNNCQAWATRTLRANGLLTGEASTFINQDVKSLAEELPSFTGKVAKDITDFGSIVNRVLQLTTGGRLGFQSGGTLKDLPSVDGCGKRRKNHLRPKGQRFGV